MKQEYKVVKTTTEATRLTTSGWKAVNGWYTIFGQLRILMEKPSPPTTKILDIG